jgi:hypothetical protein
MSKLGDRLSEIAERVRRERECPFVKDYLKASDDTGFAIGLASVPIKLKNNYDSKFEVIIDYTNWRGERRKRRIVPHDIRFDSTDWHKEPQWLVRAADVELHRQGKPAMRDFALKDIHSWRPAHG